MTNEYGEFETRARQFRDDLVAAATREADAWLAQTLSMLARLPAESRSPTGAAVNRSPGEDAPTGRVKLSDIILSIVADLPKRFTTNDVLRRIAGRYPLETPSRKSNVSTAIKNLAERGNAFVLERTGRGARPSMYKKIEGNQP